MKPGQLVNLLAQARGSTKSQVMNVQKCLRQTKLLKTHTKGPAADNISIEEAAMLILAVSLPLPAPTIPFVMERIIELRAPQIELRAPQNEYGKYGDFRESFPRVPYQTRNWDQEEGPLALLAFTIDHILETLNRREERPHFFELPSSSMQIVTYVASDMSVLELEFCRREIVVGDNQNSRTFRQTFFEPTNTNHDRAYSEALGCTAPMMICGVLNESAILPIAKAMHLTATKNEN